MTKEYLYEFAEDNNINISYTDKLVNINGLYLNVDQNDYIILNNKLSGIDEKMVLGEELSHYKVGVLPTLPFATDYYNKLIRSINEFKAKKYLTQIFLPFNEFKRFLSKNYSKYDIANEMDITEDIVEFAYWLYEPMLKGEIYGT